MKETKEAVKVSEVLTCKGTILLLLAEQILDQMTGRNGLQTCAEDNYSAIVLIICMPPGDILHIVDCVTLYGIHMTVLVSAGYHSGRSY